MESWQDKELNLTQRPKAGITEPGFEIQANWGSVYRKVERKERSKDNAINNIRVFVNKTKTT